MAQERAEQATAIAAELGLTVDEGKAWRIKGMVLAAAGQIEDALSAFEHSLELLAGQNPYETARTQLVFAQAMAAVGQNERSADLQNQAEIVLQRLGAPVELP